MVKGLPLLSGTRQGYLLSSLLRNIVSESRKTVRQEKEKCGESGKYKYGTEEEKSPAVWD